MFSQKGISIMKALVEEEIASAVEFGKISDDSVVRQYVSTLSQIRGELHNLNTGRAMDQFAVVSFGK